MTNKSGVLFNSFIKLSEDRLSVRYSNQNIPFRIGKIDLSEEQRTTLDDGKTLHIPDVVLGSGERLDIYAQWSKKEDKIICYREDPDLFQNGTQQQQTHTPQQTQQQQSHYHEQSETSGGLGLFDLPADGGDDPEETQFRNRMQQQQKKKRVRRM